MPSDDATVTITGYPDNNNLAFTVNHILNRIEAGTYITDIEKTNTYWKASTLFVHAQVFLGDGEDADKIEATELIPM